MSEIREELKYSKSHEWIRLEGNHVVVGITDYAQERLGDLVFVELPEVGQFVEIGEECAVVESVKAASDVYSPVSGEIVEINTTLADEPELINSNPYDDGWLFKVKMGQDNASWEELLTANEYAKFLEEEEGEEMDEDD